MKNTMISKHWIPFYYGESLFLFDALNRFNRIECNAVEKDVLIAINEYHDIDVVVLHVVNEYHADNSDYAVELVKQYIDKLRGIGIILEGDDECRFYGREGYFYPFTVSLELTDSCNFRCTHCYKEAEPCKQDFIDIETIRDINETLSPYVYSLEVTGGEPTVHPCFSEIIDEIDLSDLRLLTNGSRLQYLDSKTLARFSSIQFSLYGTSARDYEIYARSSRFSDVMEGVRKVVDMGCPVTAAIILRKDSIGRMRDYFSLMNSLGVRDVRFGVSVKNGRNAIEESDWDLDFNQVKILSDEIKLLEKDYADIKVTEIDPYEDCDAFLPESAGYVLSCDGVDCNICISQSETIRPCSMLPEEFFGIYNWNEYKEILLSKGKLNFDDAVMKCHDQLKCEGRSLLSLCTHAFKAIE